MYRGLTGAHRPNWNTFLGWLVFQLESDDCDEILSPRPKFLKPLKKNINTYFVVITKAYNKGIINVINWAWCIFSWKMIRIYKISQIPWLNFSNTFNCKLISLESLWSHRVLVWTHFSQIYIQVSETANTFWRIKLFYTLCIKQKQKKYF